MARSNNRKRRIKILGHDWEVFFCDGAEYDKIDNDSSLGITIGEAKRIFLRKSTLTKETVIHEICHAYFEEICISSADLGSAQFEEVACDMFSKYGAEILDHAKDLIRFFRSLK